MVNNNRTSNKSNKTNTVSLTSGKPNWALLVGIGLLLGIVVALYYMKRSNEGFQSSNNSKPRKQSSSVMGETSLNPKKGECIVALFYTDWCPHCQHFKPHFKKAMDELNGKMDKQGKQMRLEMVDCDAHKELSKKYDVSGYPTVKILNDDGSQVEYSGERTYEGLRKFLISDD
jgi:thiol-disulfide isomerase/thioredoxin